MKDLINKYREAKRIVEIALDPNHPSNKFVRENITVEQMEQLQEMIQYMEDQGVRLIAREVN